MPVPHVQRPEIRGRRLALRFRQEHRADQLPTAREPLGIEEDFGIVGVEFVPVVLEIEPDEVRGDAGKYLVICT